MVRRNTGPLPVCAFAALAAGTFEPPLILAKFNGVRFAGKALIQYVNRLLRRLRQEPPATKLIFQIIGQDDE